MQLKPTSELEINFNGLLSIFDAENQPEYSRDPQRPSATAR